MSGKLRRNDGTCAEWSCSYFEFRSSWYGSSLRPRSRHLLAFQQAEMPDYTPLGLQKIALQAAADPTLIRCPRDGVVMRVAATRARHDGRSVPTIREFPRLPSGPGWCVVELDVECPACRRRAERVRPAADEATDRQQCSLFDVAAPTRTNATRHAIPR